MEHNPSSVSTSVLVINCTPRGVVAQVESATSKGSALCFLTNERAALLGIKVPVKSTTWSQLSKQKRKAKDAFRKYSEANTQRVPIKLTPYPLTVKGEPWLVNGSEEPFHGLYEATS